MFQKNRAPRWLTIDEAKNILFDIDKENIIRYALRRNRWGVLEYNTEIFMEIIFPPLSFTNSAGIQHYKCKVALLEFDYETKSWILDKEVLTLTITGRDFRWMTGVKIKAGDRIKCFPYFYKSPHHGVRRSVNFEVTKRNSPKD